MRTFFLSSLPLLSSFYFFYNLDTPFVAFQFHGVMILFWEFREVSAYRSWRASIIRKVLKTPLLPLFTVSLSSVYRIVWRDLCARFSRDTGREKRIRERKREGKRKRKKSRYVERSRDTCATRSRDAPVVPHHAFLDVFILLITVMLP